MKANMQERAMNLKRKIMLGALATVIAVPTIAMSDKVSITPDLTKVTVSRGDQDVDIMRNQDKANTVNPAFANPAHKIKWYRGGGQDWEVLGLSTVK